MMTDYSQDYNSTLVLHTLDDAKLWIDEHLTIICRGILTPNFSEMSLDMQCVEFAVSSTDKVNLFTLRFNSLNNFNAEAPVSKGLRDLLLKIHNKGALFNTALEKDYKVEEDLSVSVKEILHKGFKAITAKNRPFHDEYSVTKTPDEIFDFEHFDFNRDNAQLSVFKRYYSMARCRISTQLHNIHNKEIYDNVGKITFNYDANVESKYDHE